MMRELALLAPVAGLAIGAAALLNGVAGAQGAPGQALFSANCAACHQEDGKGVEGAFPALAGSTFANGAPDAVIELVLRGRNGMPSFAADLNDQQIAQILSHVRSSWGNAAPAISTEAVAARRATLR